MDFDITALPAFSLDQNYIWLIRDGKKIVVVDPGIGEIVVDYFNAHPELTLSEIWVTHGHYDHTGGLLLLHKTYPDIPVRGFKTISGVNMPVDEGSTFSWAGKKVTIWKTPGHKRDHVIYLLDANPLRVFCGDILFSAGTGRNFEGTLEELFTSIQRLATLPEDSLFYPGHEYTRGNLRFAAMLEPENAVVKSTLAEIQDGDVTLPVTLEHEKAVNPFLRLREPAIIRYAEEAAGVKNPTPLAIFTYLRRLKDNF